MVARVWPDTEPGLLDLFPLIFVAWSDLELDRTEVASIRDVCACDDPGIRTALASWLDPTAPPTAAELAEVLRWIRDTEPDPAFTPTDTLRRLEHAVGESATVARNAQIETHVHAWPSPEVTTPSFDVRRLADLLDGPWREHRDRMRTHLETLEHVYGRTVEEQRAYTRDQVIALARGGFGDLAYPGITTEQPTMGPFLAAFETLATFDLGLWVKAGVQLGLFGGSIYFLGTERHHARLKQVAQGELLGCFAMSETGHGSNVRELGTTATWDGERKGFVVHTPHEGDRKDYVGNAAADGRLATVFAQLEVDGQGYGVHAFLVPIRDAEGRPAPGVTLIDDGEKLGLNGVDNGRIAFDAVFVPAEALLDRFGRVTDDGVYDSPIASPSRRFFTMIGTLVGGRVSVANAALSASKVALAIAIRYSLRRRQFGGEDGNEVTLASYPSHQRRLMPLLAGTVALDFALEDLTRRYEDEAREDGDRRELEALAAGLKSLATWRNTKVIQDCREACGGAGYLAVNQFAALKADSDVFTTFEGDNTVLMQLVAKAVLTGFQQQFTEQRALGLVRFVTDRVDSTLHRLNPLEGRVTRPDRLRDPELQRELLARRAQERLVEVAGSLRRALADGASSFAAFTAVQNDALALAHAHVEQGIVDRFVEAELAEPDPQVKRVLGTLRSLHALHRIEADLGWFLEHDYIAGSMAGAIRDQIDVLCAEAMQDALHVCEAFRLPRSALSAPIARL